jgi:predicted aspartyl protease
MKYWLFILMLVPGVASASAFKCQDQDGGTVYSTTPCEDTPGLSPFVEDTDAVGGKLVLRMGADRSYRIPGEINGSPATFVVDTGTAHTDISQGVAAAAGLDACPAGKACSVSVHEISFGGFELNDVRVNITPGLQVDVRLGNNVLKRLKVSQADGALTLSRR